MNVNSAMQPDGIYGHKRSPSLRIPGHKEELQPLRDGHRALGPPQGLPVITDSPYQTDSDDPPSTIQEVLVLRRSKEVISSI